MFTESSHPSFLSSLPMRDKLRHKKKSLWLVLTCMIPEKQRSGFLDSYPDSNIDTAVQTAVVVAESTESVC